MKAVVVIVETPKQRVLFYVALVAASKTDVYKPVLEKVLAGIRPAA